MGIDWKKYPNFQFLEFQCKCSDPVCRSNQKEPDERLLVGLQKIRDMVQKPVRINSGIRCQKHNAKVGGSKHSYHLRGMAADIVIRDMTSEQIALVAEQIKEFRNGGIGTYMDMGFCHVDVGPVRRWRG